MLPNRFRYAWVSGLIITIVSLIILIVKGFSYPLLGLICFGAVVFIAGVVYNLVTKKTKNDSVLETS